MPVPVDLRSDTVTRPTEAMRRAIAAAEVGDDVYGEDPTISRLQETAAGMLGREAAMLAPSGVMANQIALRVHARPGTEVIVEADAHLVNYEDGAGALLGGVQFRTVKTPDGRLAPDLVADEIRPDAYHLTPTSLVCLEQTHNRKGGTVTPVEDIEEIGRIAQEAGVNLYLDGARMFNAAVAAGVDPSVYAEHVDGLMFSLSKGLGAPIGSVLVGDEDTIVEARRWRRRYGGAMRQAGIIAAAGLHALEHHVDRLAEDHAHARLIVETIAEEAPDAVSLAQVETNMVYVDTGDVDAPGMAGALAEDGILVGALGPSTIRLVTHLDVDSDGCRRAAQAILGLLRPA
jgi:threonine aldolase